MGMGFGVGGYSPRSTKYMMLEKTITAISMKNLRFRAFSVLPLFFVRAFSVLLHFLFRAFSVLLLFSFRASTGYMKLEKTITAISMKNLHSRGHLQYAV